MAPVIDKSVSNQNEIAQYKLKKWIKYIVLFLCCLVVLYQFFECFTKLLQPPITTHTHFDLNATVSYPAITICRDPPYKYEILEKYNLSIHPKYANCWESFPFNTIDLNTFFEESTYNPNEYFVQYGLKNFKNNVKIVSNNHLMFGQCQTLVPLVTTTKSFKSEGYSILLSHHIKDISETLSDIPPGWHIYLHDPNENFSEVNMESTGRVEYFYLTVGEDVEIKLTAHHFNKLPSIKKYCSFDRSYSQIICLKKCQSAVVTDPIRCTAPWVENYNHFPYCNNYTTLNYLISKYIELYEFNRSECGCIDPCDSVIYSSFVISRAPNKFHPLYAQLYLYYTSKIITVYQELPGYGLPQFIADMGGSLGFLLGLSVLGLIGILQKLFLLFCGRIIENHHQKSDYVPDTKNTNIDKEYNLSTKQTILNERKY